MINMQTSVTFNKLPKRIWYVTNNVTKQVVLTTPNTRSQARINRDALKASGVSASVGYFEPKGSATHA